MVLDVRERVLNKRERERERESKPNKKASKTSVGHVFIN